MRKRIAFVLMVFVLSGMTAPSLFSVDIRFEIVRESRQYVGSSYCRGGTSPPCFDCSGFVGYILHPYVSDLPRISRDMAVRGTPIAREQLTPGDLVFFATTSSRGTISHVAIFLGQDSIIHAISDGPNRGVNITSLNARYWRDHFHSAVRILPSRTSASVVATDSREAEESKGIEFAKGKYTGQLKAGEPHGEGIMGLNNGDIYKGEFSEGNFHGSGTYIWKNGDSFRGTFRDGEFHGEGVFTTADGARTEGEWVNGRLRSAATSSVEAPDTYMEEEDSPWETWDGFITGDYYAWRQKEQNTFEQWKKENSPGE